MNDLDYINELKKLEQRVYGLWNKIKTQINDEFDARVSTFHLLAVAIRSFKIYLILKKENLDGNEWYSRIYQSKYNQPWPHTNGKIINFRQSLNWDFLVVMLIGYTQILFSIVESKFRLFQMTIDPNALKGQRDTFYNVYTTLLTRVNKTRYEDLLDFFALIRNTIHNNGKYMDAKYNYVPIKYREKMYEFKHNEFVKYPDDVDLSNLLLLQITPDVIDMMEDIILNSELINIKSIPEPVYSLRSGFVINESD
jgi:hypothetical protein